MGTGWLLVGYFFANMMPIYSPLGFAKIVGYPMMLMGLFQLRAYHPWFRICYYLGYLSLPFAVFYTYQSLASFGLAVPMPAQTIAAVTEWVYFAFCILFELAILYAIAKFSRELAHERTVTPAYRNMIFVALFAVLYTVASIPPIANSMAGKYLALPTVFLRIAYLFLDMWLIFLCYRYICPEQSEILPESLDAMPRESREKEE